MVDVITDLSFAGSTIVIGGNQITDFIDDKNPIDVQDTETCNIEWSCNGRMLRTVKPAAVMLSITVIPGSRSDRALRRLWSRRMCNGGQVSLSEADAPLTCTISSPNPQVGNYTFSNGTCMSGAAAVSVSGQGKMGGNTYTFAFEKIS